MTSPLRLDKMQVVKDLNLFTVGVARRDKNTRRVSEIISKPQIPKRAGYKRAIGSGERWSAIRLNGIEERMSSHFQREGKGAG